MTRTGIRDKMINRLLVKVGVFFFSSYMLIARNLNRFFTLKPITINRYGKTFLVSGNLEYFYFWKYKSWEQETYRIFDRYLDKDHSFIDIGAWIGPTILYGAHIAKKAYAVEPDPLAFKELEKNVSLNPALKEKIELHKKCINSYTGKVKFGSPSQGGDTISSLRFGDLKTSWVVEGITFDDFIRENTITDCNFIKMDIEGGEAIVLPTMKEYLIKNKPVLHLSMHPLFFSNPKEDTEKIIDVLHIYNYLYLEGKNIIDVNDLLSEKRLKKRYTVVATDKEMQIA